MPRDEIGMARIAVDLAPVEGVERIKIALEIGLVDRLGQRVAALGNNPLPRHDLEPAHLAEQLVAVPDDVPAGPEQFDTRGKAVRQSHLAHCLPEGLRALVHVVVEHDEVADALHLKGELAVVFVAVLLALHFARQKLEDARDRGLDEMDTGRFERLEEPAGKPHRDHVAAPRFGAAAGGEADGARVGERRRIEVGEQALCRLVVRRKGAAIDPTVAGAVI